VAPRLGYVLSIVGGLLFLAFCYIFMFRWRKSNFANAKKGLLPDDPSAQVLNKMPVDLIVEVMHGSGKQANVTFSAWDFAGQV
jgi:hypothetical protein